MKDILKIEMRYHNTGLANEFYKLYTEILYDSKYKFDHFELLNGRIREDLQTVKNFTDSEETFKREFYTTSRKAISSIEKHLVK